MNAPPSNRRVLNVPIERPSKIVTRDEFAAMTLRDAQCAETWFSGPASFAAQAARDRRVLLGAVSLYAQACEDLRTHLQAMIDEDTPAG